MLGGETKVSLRIKMRGRIYRKKILSYKTKDKAVKAVCDEMGKGALRRVVMDLLYRMSFFNLFLYLKKQIKMVK